jgi:hypothetical protein
LIVEGLLFFRQLLLFEGNGELFLVQEERIVLDLKGFYQQIRKLYGEDPSQ